MSLGLLAGLWEFPSLLLEEESSELKHKRALCAVISRMLGTSVTGTLLQHIGDVSTSLTHRDKVFVYLCNNPLTDHWLITDWSLTDGCLQVVHIFSHIHQTYVVHIVRLKDTQTHTENTQWLSRAALQEAAVSTGVKKVCVLVTQQCVCVCVCVLWW